MISLFTEQRHGPVEGLAAARLELAGRGPYHEQSCRKSVERFRRFGAKLSLLCPDPFQGLGAQRPEGRGQEEQGSILARTQCSGNSKR